MPSVLLIEDDPEIIRMLDRTFRRQGWSVSWAENGQDGMQAYERERADVVLLDIGLPVVSGMHVLEVLAMRGAVVVMLTGETEVELAVQAMQLGAENFLTKPVNLVHLKEAVGRALEKSQLRAANLWLTERLQGAPARPAFGVSPKMLELERQVDLIAASGRSTVLLRGESGTGKGWTAAAIHARSPRAGRPFVELNCAGLSANFLDSELFGHEKGAFTDAKTMKRGLFEVADGGTLFLDEIGDLAPDLQPKLLKVLEQQSFRRLGATRETTVDVRLIAATNKNLVDEVRAGRFREDLYFRICVLPLAIPPLRERTREDVVELVHRLYAELLKQQPRPARLSTPVLELLLRYEWPGNVRELRNVLERALVLAAGEEEIQPQHLPEALLTPHLSATARANDPGLTSLAEMERLHIERVLLRCNGNRSHAAEVLGISRATLYNKLRLYELDGSPPAAPPGA